MIAALLFIVLLACSPAAQSQHALTPFTAKYRLYVNKIPLPIKAELKLEKTENNRYDLRLHSKSFLLSNTEQSIFEWNQCDPKPIRYFHEFKGFGKHSFHHMDFSWDALLNEEQHQIKFPVVVNESEEGDHTYPITDNTLDDLTMLLRARCVFTDGASEYEAVSAYGRRLRIHHFELEGEEQVKTPEGTVRTLRIVKRRDKDSQRRTVFWIAPSLNYLIVKAKHIENAALHGSLILKSLSMDESNTPQEKQPADRH